MEVMWGCKIITGRHASLASLVLPVWGSFENRGRKKKRGPLGATVIVRYLVGNGGQEPHPVAARLLRRRDCQPVRQVRGDHGLWRRGLRGGLRGWGIPDRRSTDDVRILWGGGSGERAVGAVGGTWKVSDLRDPVSGMRDCRQRPGL